MIVRKNSKDSSDSSDSNCWKLKLELTNIESHCDEDNKGKPCIESHKKVDNGN